MTMFRVSPCRGRQPSSTVTIPTFWLVLLLLPSIAPARETGSLTGTVTTTNGQDLVLAVARIPDLGVAVDIAADGTFRFDDVRAGSHLLEVVAPGVGIAAQRVTIDAGDVTSVEVALQAGVHSEEIVVSASALARSPFELASPTTSLSGHQLDLRLESSLGETLTGEPGIHSTFFGPGASHPVIRGMTSRRTRVLEGGIGTGDASGLSADHALTTEPFQADRIEILRGPGTLLYGSGAIGGVVNVVDERVPSVQRRGVRGDVELRGGTAASERQGAVSLGGGNERWAWDLAATARETDDYEIPGFARAEAGHDDEHDDGDDGDDGHDEEEEENPFGIVPNSDIESQSVRGGATYFFGDRGFLGASVSGFYTEYGLPGGHGHEEEGHEDESDGDEPHGDEEEEEAPVRLDMQQRRFDVRGQVNSPFAAFQALKIRVGGTDYEHVEREGDDVGTTYFSNLFETRFELVQTPRGRHSGSIGVQYLDSDVEAIGEEAFIPATTTQQLAVFTLQEFAAGPLTWQVGARFERQDADPEAQSSRSHDGLSASVGLVWQASQRLSLAVSGARSVRLPGADELFADGLHVATRAFEIGDPTLEEEIGTGLDVSLRAEGEIFSGELTFFRQDYSDFIYQAFTGEEEDGFPVVVFTQEDANFSGIELKGRLELFDRDQHHVHLLLMGDLVDAELDRGGDLPRTPPVRLGASLHYHGDRWNASTEVRWVDDQDDLAENETPTEGYTLLNASLGYRLVLGAQVVDLLLRCRNLTDEEARSHTSFLKDVAPLPGRNITLSAKLRF